MSRMILDKHGHPIPAFVWSTVRSIPFGATATETAVLNTEIVRVVADIGCHIIFSSSGTVATTDSVLPGNVVEYPALIPVVDRIQVLAATDTGAGVLGTLWVTELI